jgi:hypothetical protein
MKKLIKLTESDILRIVNKILEEEEEDIIEDQSDLLYKSEYNPTDKTILSSYYLLNETDKYWEVLNIIENEIKNRIWPNGEIDYRFYPTSFKLPKSQVTEVGQVPNTNFFIFKIPYWLYKKEPKMEVKRIKGLKKFTHPDIKTVEDVVNFETLSKALKELGADENKIKGLGISVGHLRNLKNK